jgi:hypothetical protein
VVARAAAIGLVLGLAAAGHGVVGAQRILPDGQVRFDPKGEVFTLTFDDGTTCTISVDIWEPGSWILPITVNDQAGAAVFKEGTPPEPTWQVKDEVERYANIVKHTFRDSADMRAKVKRACEAKGGHVAIRLVRDDPNHVVARAFGSANLIVLDPVDIERLGRAFRTTDAGAARSDANSNSLDMGLMFPVTVVAHELDHFGGADHTDPDPGDPDQQGKPVKDENAVMRDLGWKIERVSYMSGFGSDHRVNGFTGRIDLTTLADSHYRRQFQFLPPSLLPENTWQDLGLIPDRPCGTGDGHFCFPTDGDLDGLFGDQDNCGAHFNPGQIDANGNGVGDSCDPPIADRSRPEPLYYAQHVPPGNLLRPLTTASSFGDRQRMAARLNRLRAWFPGGLLGGLALLKVPPRLVDWTNLQDDPHVGAYAVSLGGASGDVLRLVLVSDGTRPVQLVGIAAALEPVRNLTEAQLARGLPSGARRMETVVESYCLDLAKDPPAPGVVYRFAPAAVQQAIDPARQALAAATRVAHRGELHPDSPPDDYRTSIAQWAVWTVREGFDEGEFTNALVAHTRRNATAAGATWTPAIERAVRGAAPNRWRDVSAIIAESRREAGGAPGAAR